MKKTLFFYNFFCNIKSITFPLLLVVAFLSFLSCSLDYGNQLSPEESVPEITLQNVLFSRTQEGKVAISMQSDYMEQYKENSITLAKNISFIVLDSDEKIVSNGKCDIMSADTKNNEYIFLDNINLQNESNGIKVKGENLKWKSDTEQLTSGTSSRVTVEKDGISLTGIGFTASAISNTFVFTGNVQGKFSDDDIVELDEQNQGQSNKASRFKSYGLEGK